MGKKPSAKMLAAMQETAAAAPPEEKLAPLREALRQLHATEARIRELETELEIFSAHKKKLAHETLPELFDSVGLDKFGLPDVGDHGVDMVLESYVHANIKEENADGAFAWLEEVGSGDIIKVLFTMQFGRDELFKAYWLQAMIQTFSKELDAADGSLGRMPIPEIKKTVPWNTLTAWLKDYLRRRSEFLLAQAANPDLEDMPAPPLDLLGATVGRVVKIKPRKG